MRSLSSTLTPPLAMASSIWYSCPSILTVAMRFVFPFICCWLYIVLMQGGLLDELEFVEQPALLKLLFGDRVVGCRGKRWHRAGHRCRRLFGSCFGSGRRLNGSLRQLACLASAGTLRFLSTFFFLPLVMALFTLRQLLLQFLKQ